MRKFLGGSAVAAGVLAAGLLAGYWHFADLMPQREPGGPSRPAGPSDPSAGAPTPPAPEAAGPATISAQTDAERPAAEAAPTESMPVAPPAEAAEASPPEGTPSFDLLRVEPDGSAVVAGQAVPGGEIVLRRGNTVIARDVAGPSGGFAMTLDTPLAVGEHQLRLETTGPDGAALTSPETAIVSVPPRGREDELLVAVEQPDAATRLLSVPAASTSDISGVATPIVASTAADEVPAPVAGEPGGTEDRIDTASLADPVPAAPPTTPAAPDGNTLGIAAVEIEGENVYIAGRTKPGSTVRLYLDGEFLAETGGGASSSEFVAEATADVAVGPHVVRADEVGPDGSVIARVEVPFDRPDGNSMAALAPETGTPVDAGPAEEPSGGAVGAPAAIAAAPLRGQQESEAPSAAGQADTPDAPQGVAAAAAEPGESPDEPPSAPAAAATAAAPTEPGAPEDLSASAAPRPGSDAPAASAQASSPSAIARTQAALEPVEGRVIIRRGDTLWRISRNAYGLGSRYTVIYLANGDQIRDPDLIYPGQVFRMPGDRSAEGRSALR